MLPLLLETVRPLNPMAHLSPFVKAELLFLILILLTVAFKRTILSYCDDNVGLCVLQEH